MGRAQGSIPDTTYVISNRESIMTQGASASNPRTETTVSLFVWAALVTYEEIVNSTGDAPSAMWKKGENVQGSLITRKEDG
jgi:hypothetical protein